MNPIKFVFAGINDHLHSRGFLSRLTEPTTAEAAVWPAIKDILESMGEVVDTLKWWIPWIPTSPGWTKICVCDCGFALRREI